MKVRCRADLGRLIAGARKTGVGATPPLPRVPAKVGLANPKPAPDLGDGDYSFMCRVSDTGPLMIYPPVLRAGVRKPSGKEPAGAWWAAWGLWGFYRAATAARAARAGAFDGGSTIGVENSSPLLPLSR